MKCVITIEIRFVEKLIKFQHNFIKISDNSTEYMLKLYYLYLNESLFMFMSGLYKIPFPKGEWDGIMSRKDCQR